MSATLDEARIRIIENLDVFLGSLRSAYDDSEPEHMIRQIDYLRLQILGIVPSVFEKGVIFGLIICRSGDLQHLYQGGMMGVGMVPVDSSPSSWVIPRGEIWNGTEIKQLIPADGYDYVYELTLPSSLSSASNSLAIGSLFYMTDTESFKVILLGQTLITDPSALIEKSNLNVDEFVSRMMGYDELDQEFIIPNPTNGIRIARLVIDVNDFSAGDYTIHARPERDLYPFPTGMSFDKMRSLSKKISDVRKYADMPSFDDTIVSELLLSIFRSPTWVPDFETYWSSPRTMPTNVRYYYDILESEI